MPTNPNQPQREEFDDGSAIVTYPDGSQLLVESKRVRALVAQESPRRKVNYSEPPPPNRSN